VWVGQSMIANAVLGLMPSTQLRSRRRYLSPRRQPARLTSRDARLEEADQCDHPGSMSALNPVRNIRAVRQVSRPIHRAAGWRERRMRELLDLAHLATPPLPRFYPFELSGASARLHDLNGYGAQSGFLIADEPTTALDVTTQTQILHLIEDCRGVSPRRSLHHHDFGSSPKLR